MDKNLNKFSIKKIAIIIFIILAFLLFIFSIFFSLININNNNILNGISINDIDISGMSKEEATKTINQIISEKDNNITITADEQYETSTTFDYLQVNYNIGNYINEAYNIGRQGNIFQNNFEILDLILNKRNLELNIDLNEDNLNALADEISTNLPNKLIQSSYYIEDKKLVITKGASGDIVDKEKFKQNLYITLKDLSQKNNYVEIPLKNVSPKEVDIDEIYKDIYKEVKNAYYEKQPFKLYPEVIGVSFDKENAINLLKNDQEEYIIELKYTYPEKTVKDLDINFFKDKLGYFTTKYDLSNEDRTTNLELAASKINETIIAPGEEFSYNTIVGARTIEKGYREAKIYSNGQVVDGLGGGICQISSTLYNAVFFANLEVTERHNHMFTTSYVPAGRDATVVYGSRDFKFKNNRSYPIKIEMKVSNSIVYCQILRF